eukprot:scaffold45453_cov32-Tisochrysis_lutea.AAC.6
MRRADPGTRRRGSTRCREAARDAAAVAIAAAHLVPGRRSLSRPRSLVARARGGRRGVPHRGPICMAGTERPPDSRRDLEGEGVRRERSSRRETEAHSHVLAWRRALEPYAAGLEHAAQPRGDAAAGAHPSPLLSRSHSPSGRPDHHMYHHPLLILFLVEYDAATCRLVCLFLLARCSLWGFSQQIFGILHVGRAIMSWGMYEQYESRLNLNIAAYPYRALDQPQPPASTQ